MILKFSIVAEREIEAAADYYENEGASCLAPKVG